MLKKKTALIVLSIVMAFALLAGLALMQVFSRADNPPERSEGVIGSGTSADTTASAAITAATSFGQFITGSKYYYTSPTSATEVAVTVDSTKGLGTQQNPYVINNTSQWVYFANLINANNTVYNGKYYVLGADLNFGNNVVNPVGYGTATGFTGVLYGNKHTISNIKFNMVSSTITPPLSHGGNESGFKAIGLFGYLNGAQVYDINFSSITFSYTPNSNVSAGMLAAYANNATIVGVNSTVAVTVSQSGASSTPYMWVGGLVGKACGGFFRIYKSSFVANINTTACASTVTSAVDNSHAVGGIVGGTTGCTEFTCDVVSVKFTFTSNGGGIVSGGLIGGNGSSGILFRISNVIVNCEWVQNTGYPYNSPDVRGLTGWLIHAADMAPESGSYLNNCYFSSETYKGELISYDTAASTLPSSVVYRYTGADVTTAVGKNVSNQVTTVAAVGNAAASNTSLTAYYTITGSTATPTQKTVTTYHLSLAKGAGASGGTNDITYTYSANAQTPTINPPSRTGYTFKGWSLTGYQGDVSGTTSKLTIPAGQRGDLNVYAVWEVNAFQGTAPSDATITYGSSATFSAAGLSSPPGTSSSTYGVNISYEWRVSGSSSIIGTDNKYTVSNPSATSSTGTTYTVTVKATPKDGVTAARSTTYSVKLIVKKKGVAIPTAVSGLIYNGSQQTGVVATTDCTVTGNTGTNATSYTAVAALPNTSNYCWGSDGSSDSSATKNITWSIGKATIAVPTISATSFTYNGSLQKPTTSTNNAYTVVNNGGTNVGSYSATFTFKTVTSGTSTICNYKWATAPSTGESGVYTLSYSIGKASVAVPSITSATSVVYNAAKQTPTTTTSSLYNVTNNGGTNVGSYNVEFALKDTTNYKWTTAQSGKGESDKYVLSWSITKADITLSAPTAISDSIDGRLYVGQTLGTTASGDNSGIITINQSSGGHVRAGSTASVAGTYAWVNNNTKVTSSGTVLLPVSFTPTDTANYNTPSTINMSVTVIQLKLIVRELGIHFYDANNVEVTFDSYTLNMNEAANKNLARTITSSRNYARDVKELNVAYGEAFTLSKLNVARGTTVNGAELNWQQPVGYNIEYFNAVNGDNTGNANSKILTTDTEAIYANKTIYLGYTAQPVHYTVVTVKEDLVPKYFGTSSGAGEHGATPTNAEIIAHLNGTKALTGDALKCIEVSSTSTAAAGAKVSATAKTIEGFTRKTSLKKDGESTYISDDSAKFVLGTGDTVLITYYERNNYTVTWNYNGGTAVNVTDKTAPDVANRLPYVLKYGETFEVLDDPTYDGGQYTFEGWYLESGCINRATLPTTMPANNVAFYAGRTAQKFTITFNYALDALADSLGLMTMPEDYEPVRPSDGTAAKIDDLVYTVEQIINTGIIRLPTPTLAGFKFVSWVYEDENGDDRNISTVTRTTAKSYTLRATWSPMTYTIALNTNGGNRVTPSQIKVPNLNAYGDNTLATPRTLPTPTRAGFTFIGWTYVQNPDNMDAYLIVDDEMFNSVKHGTTLYAQWRANPVIIKFNEGIEDTPVYGVDITSSDYVDSDGNPITFQPDLTENQYSDQWGEFVVVKKDSVLTINIRPENGYEIASVSVGGVSFTNGGRFTVRTYDDDVMHITAVLRAKRYNISYVYNGGQYRGTEDLVDKFTIDDTDVYLPGGNWLAKTGYVFAGWIPNDSDPDTMTEPVGDYAKTWSSIDAGEYLGARNTTLYAKWTPAPVTMVYNNNYRQTSPDGSITTMEKTYTVEGEVAEVYTGTTFDLWSPGEYNPNAVGGSFTPQNRELIGWATSPDGDIAYSISYTFEGDGLLAQPTQYTARASADNTNTLYAIWRITNVQYVVFEAENNNTQYRDDADYTGVTLTARPLYAYEREDSLRLKFRWYKVDKSWEKWTEADLDDPTLTEDQRNQRLSYVGMYKIPDGTPVLQESPTLHGNISAAEQCDIFGNGKLKNVSDSGLYICALAATGSYYTLTEGLKTSTITMYGQYEVIVNKTNLDEISLTTPDNASVYNGQLQGLEVTTVWTKDYATGAYRLPDGSQLAVTYTYTNLETRDEFVGGVTDVGTYRVVASFSFPKDKDKGNYITPDDVYAEFEISQRPITAVDYVIETVVDGDWVEIDSFDENTYTGEEFRIIAKPQNVVNNDDVSIVLFYDGDLNADGKAVNVGSYIAYCDQLAGEGKDNYSLSSDIDGCEFAIIKAEHNIDITFENATITYDGNFVDMTNQNADDGAIRLVITENGNPIDIVTVRNNKDEIELAKGYVITLTYTREVKYVEASFEPNPDDMESPSELYRGGRDAGEYVITISFADTPENEVNFEVMDDVSATLTIKQAKYRSDGTNVGLTDAELNTAGSEVVDGDNKLVNPGFGRGIVTADFNAQTTYDPLIIFADDVKDNFEVSYRYEYTLNNTDGSAGTVQRANSREDMFANGNTISAAGTYRITASIAYDNTQYANNYEALSDYTIELKITPGSIDHIEVVYDQEGHEDGLVGIMNPITYGDTFDFLDANAKGYVVKITAVYEGAGGRESINPTSAQFFSEDGVTPFTIFNRATIASNVDTSDLDTAEDIDDQGDYIVKVKAYGKFGEMKVKVRQKELTYDNIGFDATNDSNIHLPIGNVWSYTLSYDGESRFPALANDNNAFNFVGITNDKLTGTLSTDAAVNPTITAKYQYEDTTGNYVDLPANGFANAGTYNIRVTFTNNNKNYAPLDSAKTALDCTMTVSPKLIAGNDIQWRYSSNSSFTPEKTYVLAQGANLTYCGEAGFYVMAVYRNLAVKDDKADDAYLSVAKIKIDGSADDGEHVQLTDADSYKIIIQELDSNANYKLASGEISANVTIDPAKVDLTWQLTGGVDSLTYNGKNQLTTGVSAQYTPPAEHNVGKQPVTIKVVGDDPDTVYPLIKAGNYTLSATLTDKNYTPTNATFNVTVDPIKVNSDNTTITWYYVDAQTNKNVVITDDARIIDYVGANVPVFIKYSVQGDDLGEATDESDPENTYRYRVIAATSADGTDVHNAGTYDMVGALSQNGNYDLSEVTQKFTIRKKVVEVTWTGEEEYTYDGTTHEIVASVTPVGKELDKGVTIINVAEASKRNAGEYVAGVSLHDDYVKNYELKDNTDGIVTYKWKINKLKVELEWNTGSLVYNRGYALDNWSVAVTNIPVDEEGNPVESVDLLVEIYRGEVAEANVVSGMTLAGKYIIKVIAATDDNYSVAEVANREVNVAKATATMKDVVYTEYADNTTYQGNVHGLRDDKLTGKAVIDGAEVKGVITFVDAKYADLSTVDKNKKFACVFTPDDKDNYNVVEFDHVINVAADEIKRIGFDKSTIATTYAVGQSFTKRTVKLYFEYKSYYEEVVHDGAKSVTTVYGSHIAIDRDDPTFDVDFIFNNIPIDGSKYVFKESDIGENRLISVHATAPNGKDYSGDIRVNVINAKPVKMTIINKEELKARDYFVGTKFDKSLLQVYVEYETESSNAIISNEYIDLATPVLPAEPVVSHKLTFTYFTNTELQVSDSIEIRVRDKIKVDVKFNDATVKWENDKLLELPQVLTKDGDPLPEGVSCTPIITDANGKGKELKERGEYTVVLKFTVDENMYYHIDDITAKITVKEIKAIIDQNLLVKPIESRKYSGKVLTADDYILKNIAVIDSDGNTDITYEVVADKTVYTINGRPADSVKMLEAGTYKLVASITVLAHNGDDTTELPIDPFAYEIKIEKAENEIDTFVINNWVYGKTPSTVNIHSTFGEADIIYYSLNANNQYDQVYLQLPENPGNYVAVATVHGTVSYDQVTKEASFKITRPELAPAQDSSEDRESLIDDEGNYKVKLTSGKGVDPAYNLRVEVLKNTDEMLKKQKQIVLAGYDIDVVDAKGNVVENPGEYTVKLLLTAEQRSARNIKVYSVDEYGYTTEISGATVDNDGYITFTTSNFNGNFVVGARDAAASSQLGWIIGLSAGGLVALAAIIILIIVVIKKKKEND